MEWKFKLPYASNTLTLAAEVIYTSYQIEQIKVSGDGLSMLLENNRPLLEAIDLDRPIKWKLIEGETLPNFDLTKITSAIEQYLKQHDYLPR